MAFKFLAPIVGFVLFFNSVVAQQSIHYLKNNGKEVNGPGEADYKRVFSAVDPASQLCDVVEYYLNGTTKATGKSAKAEYLWRQGKFTKFYPSGKMEEASTYIDNEAVGEKVNYYPNGNIYTVKKYADTIGHRGGGDFDHEYMIITCNDSTGRALVVNGNGHYVSYVNNFKDIDEEGDLKNGVADGAWKGNNNDKKSWITFEEVYKDGKLVSGRSKSDGGKVVNYTIREREPGYEGGLEKFYAFLGQNIKYPAKARENNVQGKVVLSFVIEKDGTLADIKVTRSVNKAIDDEAVRVMKMSPKWMPGIKYGSAVRVMFSVPIGFSLQ